MSLLSSTQGTPERVLSLVQVLAAHDGALPKSELIGWLNPGFRRDGSIRGTSNTAAEQTISAAVSLGLITTEDAACALVPEFEITSLAELADHTHDRLNGADIDDDGVLPRAFAFVAVRSEEAQGTGWLHDMANLALSDAINAALPPRENAAAEGRRFNETKVAPFWRWIEFAGLSVDLAGSAHPYVAARLERELARANLPKAKEIPIREALAVIIERMPYLDGGGHYREVADRLGLPATPRTLSPLLSTALRDLHEDGVLVLGTRSDAAGVMGLAPDLISPIKGVQHLTLTPERADV